MSFPATTNLNIIRGNTFTQTFNRMGETYLNYEGEWTDLTEYEVDDVVTYKDEVYKCILDTTAAQKPTNATYFGSVTPYDYTSPVLHTLEAKIRTDFREEASIVDFTVDYLTDGTDGKYVISLTAAQTEVLDFDEAVYDIEVTSGSTVWKEYRGKIKLDNEVTR